MFLYGSYCLLRIDLLSLSYSWPITGCLQLLEISCYLYGPPGNFCVTCRWSTALVSNHDKTGYRIAYLRNWSTFLSLPRPPCCAYHVFVLYLGKLVDSVHCVAGRSNASMSWIFLEILPGISWKSPGNLFSYICRHPVYQPWYVACCRANIP